MKSHTYQIAGALVLVPWLAFAEGIASLNDSPQTGGGVPSNAGTMNGSPAVPGPSTGGAPSTISPNGTGTGTGGITGQTTDSLADPTLPHVPTPTPSPATPAPTVIGSSIGSSQEAVRDAQRALSANGFTVAQDGVLGPNTQNAIRDFQARNGLAQTGELDADTVRSLNSSGETRQQQSTVPEGSAMEFPSGF